MPHIETVEIQNYRNHDHVQLAFKKGINVIWGENGSGKTAALEAVYTLSMGRSFRTRNHKETLKENASKSFLRGTFNTNNAVREIKLNHLSTGQRRFFINGTSIKKTMDLIGKTPIVLLSPEEQIITKGSPGDRRDYFNKILSIISREYLKTLLIYQRLIKQRNFALRETRKSHTNHAAIIAWNEPVVSTGKKTLETKNRLESSLSSDIVKGRTIAGPHRDEYCFTFNGRLLRNFGSQGEHKLALVLIKMAEINTIKTATGKTPILMLDDFFAKLDFQRADGALSLLNGEYQTIITTTDIVDIEKHGIDLKSENNTSLHMERTCKA
ncbi:MAG: AAA family ATPase [Candidatus Marinimicrobia bacterium]|jgi:DNA replication and repair protein RecF|nr:AAA family ATPase [Candidatus Neomarinimicrobiota bacterium]|tara:strand:- start:19549 stop:20526 length:978 start_codon:yes stop_codon:yes gene_type:complete